jgi:hypothetical protein
MGRLKGRIAIVTVAASGLGLASGDSAFVTGIELVVDGGNAQV